jgi:hypothetical protein
MNETLVIVHLSSLESYVQYYGPDAALQFTTDIKVAIMTHPGPVVIMDQEWSEISEDTRVLRNSILDLQQFHRFTLFHHDELTDLSPWQNGMKELAKLLRSLKTSRVRLGGLWTSHNHATGCVHEVQRQLRARNIPCYIDPKISALEEDDPRT